MQGVLSARWNEEVARARGRSSIVPVLPVSLALVICGVLFGPVAGAWAGSCPNEAFRTGPGSNLPDCRAYEMVSPPEKNGGEIDGGPVLEGTPPSPEQAALNGEAVTYGSTTTFPEANPLSAPVTSQYISRRGPAGWYTQAITPVQNEPGGVLNREQGAVDFSLFHGFTEDLSHAFMLAYEPSPVAEAPAKYYNPYVRNNLDNTYRLLSKEKPPVQIPGISNIFQGFRIEFAGMSSDGSHVVFSANDKLTPGALPGHNNLYESSDGRLELVSVLPTTGEATSGSVFGREEFDQGGLNEGYNHVISSDGSRAFWTASSEAGSEYRKIYMHELTAAGARTVQVSASQKNNGGGPGGTDPHGPLGAFYDTASIDGNEVFFTSCEKLTNDSTAGPTNGNQYGQCFRRRSISEGLDLYRYETSTGKLTDLSVDPIPGQTASLVNVLGASEDGSSVYFTAHGALVEGAPSGSSAYNIYLWHSGKISLVSTLHSGDYASEQFRDILFGGESSESVLDENNVRVSPDGRYLAFESTEPLTGYDTKPLQAGACLAVTSFWREGSIHENHTGRCIEVYEYDAAIGQLTCASCNPRGLPPLGDSVVPMSVHQLVHPAGWESQTVQQRYLLDDGRLFFDSTDALLPQASNGKLNVYEYKPGGLGSCQREGGCLSLISTGTSNGDSFFIDAGASGNDVFLLTRQQLVAQDGDEAIDVYDARVGGGFSLAAPPPCGGEACRPPVAQAPAIYGAPPSATFAGVGNPLQPAAGKAKKKSKPKKKSKRKHAVKRKTGKKAARGSRARRSSRGSHR